MGLFAATTVAADPPPPPPDYGSPSAWAGWPDRASTADALPPGVAVAPVSDRPADVFFVHPTIYFGGAPNARFDEPGAARTRLEQGVLRFQYSVPEEIERAGVPVCRAARATGCLLDWNTVPADADDNRGAERLIWLAGRYQPFAGDRRVCVNPLNWVPDGAADASLNLGALPAVGPGQALRASVPQLTGARCDAGLLRVSIPRSERRGFANLLTLFGSYHVFDYNLFYTNIRVNVAERVAAYRAAQAAAD